MNTHGIIHKQTKQYRYKTIKTTIKPSHHKNLSKVNLKLKLFYVLCVCMQASLVGLLVEFHTHNPTHMLCVKPFYLIRETFSWVDMCFWQWLVTSWVWWDLGCGGLEELSWLLSAWPWCIHIRCARFAPHSMQQQWQENRQSLAFCRQFGA